MPFPGLEQDAQARAGLLRLLWNGEAEKPVGIGRSVQQRLTTCRVLNFNEAMHDSFGFAEAALDDDFAPFHVGKDIDPMSKGRGRGEQCE
jgi:hypothetical protein